MAFLIGQILATTLTTLISIITLNGDLRSRTGKLKREARIIKRVLYFVALISVLNSFLSYWISESDKKQLANDKDSLNKSLAALRKDNIEIRSDNTNLKVELSRKLI